MGANGKEGREGEGEGMRSKTGPPYTEACTKVVAAKPSKPNRVTEVARKS